MSRICKNGNVEICVESFGQSGDAPVLLIAGAMAPKIFWDVGFCRGLASRGHHVIRFDNRDMGKSTHFPQSAPGSGVDLPYSIDDMVEDAKVVLKAHSNQPAHIIGHSLGGSIAQLFALSHPDLTRSVTIISGPILAIGDMNYIESDPVITQRLWEVLMSNRMYPDIERGASEFLKAWKALNGDWALDATMADAYTKALYETEIIAPAWNHTNVQNGIRDVYREIEQLNMPILFIHGEKDFLPADPENIKRLANRLPNAEIFILEKGGHMFFNKQIWEILLDRLVGHFQGSSFTSLENSSRARHGIP